MDVSPCRVGGQKFNWAMQRFVDLPYLWMTAEDNQTVRSSACDWHWEVQEKYYDPQTLLLKFLTILLKPAGALGILHI